MEFKKEIIEVSIVTAVIVCSVVGVRMGIEVFGKGYTPNYVSIEKCVNTNTC